WYLLQEHMATVAESYHPAPTNDNHAR
ncbi:hypothetical protein LCGC14_1770280, partial [marine sediment metagenome]